MLSVLRMGGFTTGGLNFDAKVRRESFEPVDLFYAHIGGMDAFARGLKMAAAIRADGRLAQVGQGALRVVGRGRGRGDRGGQAHAGEPGNHRAGAPDPVQRHSGRQEFIENLINDFI